VAITWLIAAGELSHVIAGSSEAALAAMQGAVSWYQYGLDFLLPALIGNSIGGVVFVALLNHAQVREEI
jgi:formate-nitrite transporter family protein